MAAFSTSTKRALPPGIVVIAVLMVLFGLAEVITSFTHSFFGLSTSQTVLSTLLGAALGICYLVGGLVLFVGRRWAAVLAISLLSVNVAGRIVMVLGGLYPLDSFRQAFGIIVGTLLAAFFAVYIALKRRSFR